MIHACTPEDMHPFECDGYGSCMHCDRRFVERKHDPATCALCDPVYDGRPNMHWVELWIGESR